MFLDIMKKYRNKEIYDLSCSETMVYTANEAYNLNLDDQTLKAMAPFSGGMWVEETCGAISGGLAVLGILFTNKVAHKSEHLKALTLEFLQDFHKKMGSRNCKDLKSTYRTEKEGCNAVMFAAGEILDAIVQRELKK